MSEKKSNTPAINQDRVIANQVSGMPLEEAIFQDGYSAGVEFEKNRGKQGPAWVKATTRLPEKSGQITWRWIDKEAAYSGYDDKRGFIYDKGGASVDPLYYIEIEWLDELGTAAGREEDGAKAQFNNWHRWLSENGYTYDGEYYYDQDNNYFTPDQLWAKFK